MTMKFDQWLEDELNRTLTPIASQPARPGQARYQAAMAQRRFIGSKAAVGLALATMALLGSGVMAAASGSLNPQVWGLQVMSTVAQCKAELQPGQHGIGGCVSAFARQHGQQMKTQHGANGPNEAVGPKHGGSRPGPPWLRPASPSPNATATP